MTTAEQDEKIASLDKKLFELKKQLQAAQNHCISAITQQLQNNPTDQDPTDQEDLPEISEDNEELEKLKLLVYDLR